jgi:hypothetical protein
MKLSFHRNAAARAARVPFETAMHAAIRRFQHTDGSMLAAAEVYAAYGFPIFPCGPDDEPLITDHLKRATTDTAVIRQWWTLWPDAQIGMPQEHLL